VMEHARVRQRDGNAARRARGKHRGARVANSTLGWFSNVRQRLVYQLINESARCLGEEIVAEAWMVDLAMVLGTGFAPFRGGPLRLADEIGIGRLVSELRRLWHTEGDRFIPCATLRRMNESGDRFFPPGFEQEAKNSGGFRSTNAENEPG